MKEFDFEFTRGDTRQLNFTLIDAEGNILVPTVGDEIFFTVKKSYNKKDYILQKRFSRNEITLNDGILSLVLSHQDTANLKYGDYVYDIQLKSDNFVNTLASGTMTLTNESTWIENE